MISVIVPVYNTEKYLRRCIDSILMQTYEDFELILVDDGSTDNSGKICDDYAAADDRIVVLHQENKGQATARNAGLDHVFEKGYSEWICFVDSDDVVHPRMLELLYQNIANTGRRLIAGDYCTFKSETELSAKRNEPSSVQLTDELPEDFFVNNSYIEVVPWGKLYHKSCFDQVRYPDGRSFEDNFTTYKIIFDQAFVLHLHHPIYYYFLNADSTTNNKWTPRKLEAFDAYHEQVVFFEKNGYQKAKEKIVVHAAAVMCNQLREVKEAENYKNYETILREMLKSHMNQYREYDSIKNNARLDDTVYPETERITRQTAKGRIKSRIVDYCLPPDGRIGAFGKLYFKYKIRKNNKKRSPSNEVYPIDFVVTWVDNSDPQWLSDKQKYEIQMNEQTRKENSSARYRDWDTFLYWFRSVEQYAPWVRKVFLVTRGHVPDWLDTENPKLRIVKHSDFIPEEYLPTFNSNAIEMNLWRIKDLEEHFVYFNDDVFLTDTVKREDFFCGGLPKHCAVTKPHYAYKRMGSFEHALWNVLGEINSKVSVRDVIRRNPEKWLSDKLPGYYEYNSRTYRDKYLSGMYYSHVCVPFRKSNMKDCTAVFSDAIGRTCSNRFRTYADINHQIFQIWEMMNGTFEPVERGYFGEVKNIRPDTIDKIVELMLKQNHRCVCINDSEQCSEDDYQKLKGRLCSLLQEKYPDKSTFEK